jgi:Dr1-associated corepressor
MLDFLKELVESVPDPSAGGTIEMEGGKPKAEGSGGGAGGAEGSKRKRRRKEGEGGSGRVRKRKGDEVEVGKEEAGEEAGEEGGEAKSEMNNKSEPEENDEIPRVERETRAVSVDMRGPGPGVEEEEWQDADDMPYMPR